MQTAVQVTFRGMPTSAETQAACLDEAEKLERHYDRITGCRVVVAAPHHHHRKGNLYEVRIDITVPHGEIVVTRTPSQHHQNEDVLVALREAFDTATRQLEEHVRKLRHDVKNHDTAHGRVARILADDGYGFIENDKGDEVFFHKDSVSHTAFDALAVGTPVSFAQHEGEKGPRASSVRVLP